MQDGRCIYVRFRHGRLSIGFGETPAAAVEGSLSRENVYEEDGNRGDMELVEMLERTGLKLAEGIEVDEDRWWLEDH